MKSILAIILSVTIVFVMATCKREHNVRDPYGNPCVVKTKGLHPMSFYYGTGVVVRAEAKFAIIKVNKKNLVTREYWHIVGDSVPVYISIFLDGTMFANTTILHPTTKMERIHK